MMTQTLAIFYDAYRALNARKLFWISLGLSAVVVLSFATVGINEKGLTFFHWQIGIDAFSTQFISRETFYKLIFTTLGVRFWITFLATILGLISTAGVIPDLVSDGAIDLVLSKPIGRVRLFLTKYVTGLLFVTLQVAVFTTLSFFVIGLRGGAWEPGLFITIPMVILFYSYIYSVCALLGLITRSTVAALLLTILFWVLNGSLHLTESSLLIARTNFEVRVEAIETDINERAQQLADLTELAADAPDDRKIAAKLANQQRMLDVRTQELPDEIGKRDIFQRIHFGVMAIKTLLPKTTETIDLTERWLISSADMEGLSNQAAQEPPPMTFSTDPDDIAVSNRKVSGEIQDRIEQAARERSVAWIVGTSVIFEAVMLAIACWIFRRRDF